MATARSVPCLVVDSVMSSRRNSIALGIVVDNSLLTCVSVQATLVKSGELLRGIEMNTTLNFGYGDAGP